MHYLNCDPVHGQGGADHVDIWSGGGALFLRERASGGRDGGDVVEGVWGGVSVMGAEKVENSSEDSSKKRALVTVVVARWLLWHHKALLGLLC